MTDEHSLDDGVYGAFDRNEQRDLEDAVLARLGIGDAASGHVVKFPRRRGVVMSAAACVLAAASFWLAILPGAHELPPYQLIPPAANAAQRGRTPATTGRYGLERELALVLRPARPSKQPAAARVFALHGARWQAQPAMIERDAAGALRLRLRPAEDGLARAGQTWELRVLLGPEADLARHDFDPRDPPAGVQAFALTLPLD